MKETYQVEIPIINMRSKGSSIYN